MLGAITTPVFAETTTEDPSTQQLSTIVVSAAGFEQDIKKAPASITVLNQEDLKSKRVNSLADALRGVEGVEGVEGAVVAAANRRWRRSDQLTVIEE